MVLLHVTLLCILTSTIAQNSIQQCTDCLHHVKTWCPETKTCEEKTTNCSTPITYILNCPRSPDPAYAYNDSFARDYITPLIGGLFLDTPEKCLKQIPHIAYYKNLQVQCDQEHKDMCYAYTARDTVEKAIIIVIGVSSEIQGTNVTANVFGEKVAFFDDGHVYKFFSDSFIALWHGGLEKQVHSLNYQYEDYHVYITGHSLGASIASVGASYLVKWGMFLPRYIKLVTFGQPRTGDYDYADFHDAAFPYSYRVVSRHDPVPHTPPQEGDDKPFHHLYEVWYNNDMAIGQPYTICEEADGIYCSNTVTNKVDSDHWFYFNRNIKEWGQNGCPALNSKIRS